MLARIFESDLHPLRRSDRRGGLHRVWHDALTDSGYETALTPMDVLDTPDSFHVILDVPGVTRDDLDVQLDGRRLTIKAQRSIETVEGVQRLVAERQNVRFSRTVVLPRSVDRDAIEAKVDAGILRLTLPKVKSATPLKIDIT